MFMQLYRYPRCSKLGSYWNTFGFLLIKDTIRVLKKVKSSMARSLPLENLLPQNVGSIINYWQQCTEQPNGELLVAVNHNKLRTMASETVDQIDCSHPPPSWAVPPERLVHNRYKSVQPQLESNVQLQHASQPRPLRVYLIFFK